MRNILAQEKVHAGAMSDIENFHADIVREVEQAIAINE